VNPNPARDVDDYVEDRIAGDEAYEYGQDDGDLWFSPWEFDGKEPMLPRRPEMTGDGCDALVADLTSWVEWFVTTFRVQSKIPPCWVRHPALVEELLALFFLWQHCWIPAADPSLPVAFLRELDWALGRIERHWKVSCDATEHRPPQPIDFASTGVPQWQAWWANPEFNESDRAVAQLRQRTGIDR
jgi:hypothetical protein